MIIIRTFGVILLLLGLFLAYGLSKDSRLMLFGSKIKADVIGIDSVKNKRFGYVHYPILQFNYKQKQVRLVKDLSSIDPKKVPAYMEIYYEEDIGISDGFTVVYAVFSIISIIMIIFGIIAIRTKYLH
ncbi:hypothetical protein [Sphingobacterium sp. DR205]|uniref:hypothetical protein n=1 Tax=Sphingobacterium sp. DR205 TaxID=2713573 RepID=UPI0013E51CD3|nr:hypothetical protein [Sphingobacterium sp. DR205]QIH32613.1 hypothetical protein G6053_06765 [Sphingobacterium sp. DR205]